MPAAIGAFIVKNIVMIILTAVVAGVNYLNAQRQQRKLKRALAGLGNNGYLVNTRSTQEPVRVIYGQHRVGGNIVYLNVRGTNNEYLDVILTLSEGPVESSVNIWFDDALIGAFGSDAYYEFFDGDGNQALCATLQSADSNWNDYMRFTSYLYLRLKYNQDKYIGMPNFTAEIKGRKIYDPRSTLTVWSDNPALVWYDFMTNSRYGGGIPSTDINTQSVIDAANWCDTEGFTFNGVLFERQAFLDNLDDIMRNFRAFVIWSDGEYKLKTLDYDTTVMSLNEDEIVAESFTINIPGLTETPNRVKIQYPDINDNYITKDQFLADETAVLQFDLEERDMEIDLIGTTGSAQANKLGAYYLERARLNKQYSFSAHARTLALEPGDMIQVTHSLPGWTNRVVRIIEIGFAQDGWASLVVQEEDSALYDELVNLSPHTYFETNLPNPLDAPSEVTGVSFTEEGYVNKDVTYTRLNISFTAPTSPFWSYSEAWLNIDGAGYFQYQSVVGSFSVAPVKEGVNYKVKLISISIHGAKQNFASATEWSYTIVGQNNPPANVTGFSAIPLSDSVILMWTKVSDVDLLGYEIREGTSWDSGMFIGFTRAVTFPLTGVKPGTHNYMIKSLDTGGNPSPNATLISVTVYGPAAYTEKASEDNDFTVPADWQATTAYSTNDYCRPTTANGYDYECTTAGTSGATEPTWPTTIGNTVADGTAVWTCDRKSATFDNIERYNDPTYGYLLRSKHNLISNYDFETDTTGWNLGTGWARSSTEAYLNTYSIASPGDGSGAGTETYKQDSEIEVNSGESYTFQAWVWSDTASQARLRVQLESGVDNYSSYHTGDSTWQLLTVTVAVTTADSAPDVAFRKEIATGQAYFDDCKYYRSSLNGIYTSHVFDRGSTEIRRCWPNFDVVFVGTGTAWADQFSGSQLWTDKFSGSDPWLALFGQYQAGTLRMKLQYGNDAEFASYTEVDYFQSYAAEVNARFTRYIIEMTDVDSEGFMGLRARNTPGYDFTYKEAYT